MPRVAVLHHPKSFFPLDVFERVHEIAEIVWVVDSSEWAAPGSKDRGSGSDGPAAAQDVPEGRLLRRLGTLVDVVGLEPAVVAARLSTYRLDGIVSFVDHRLEFAAEVAARLDLPFHSPLVASQLVDKQRQREVLEREGLPSARFWPVPRGLDRAGAADFAARVTYPAVLKPVRGSGSLDICRVDTPPELAAALGDETRGPWLVEEYIPDTVGSPDDWYANYLSVESVVSRGQISHVAMCGRFPLATPFREAGNFMPALVEPGTERRLLQLVEDAARALGVTDSVLHTEIKLTADGPRLIEVNGRLGGRPPYVLETVSPVNLFAVTCQVAMGVPVKFERLAETSAVGFWLMLHGPHSASRVLALEGLDEVASLDGVDRVRTNRGPGERVDWQLGTDAHVLLVRGRVPTHAALADLVAAVRRTTVMTFE